MSSKSKSRVNIVVASRSQGLVGDKDQSATALSTASGKFTSRVRMRRSSFGYSGVSGIGRVVERTSMLAPEYKRPMLIYLNTYQLNPLVAFHPPLVTKAADQILDETFTDHKYNPQESPTLALRVSGELMKAVKAMSFNRYRVITIVTIAQRRAQSYNNAISFLWDNERDNYININRETPTAFIQFFTVSQVIGRMKTLLKLKHVYMHWHVWYFNFATSLTELKRRRLRTILYQLTDLIKNKQV